MCLSRSHYPFIRGRILCIVVLNGSSVHTGVHMPLPHTDFISSGCFHVTGSAVVLQCLSTFHYIFYKGCGNLHVSHQVLSFVFLITPIFTGMNFV